MEITWVFKERKRGQVEREGVGRDKRWKSRGEKEEKENQRTNKTNRKQIANLNLIVTNLMALK